MKMAIKAVLVVTLEKVEQKEGHAIDI